MNGLHDFVGKWKSRMTLLRARGHALLCMEAPMRLNVLHQVGNGTNDGIHP